MPLQPYASRLERIWYYTIRGFCVLVLIGLILPIFAIIPISFTSDTMLSYPMPSLSFRWYTEFFSSVMWTLSMKNSFIIAFATTFVATALGTLAALGLTMSDFPFKGVVTGMMIMPMVVPIVISAVGIYFFFASVDLTSTHLGMILAHTALATPFVVITVTATLQGFHRNQIRAGSSLGASPVTVFFKITLPQILPGVISGALFAFVTSFDEVVVALFIAGSEQYTLPRQMFAGIREKYNPTIAAVATMMIIVSIALLVTVELLRRRSERLRGIRQ
ncbi:MAG: ABC transporter permease [Desulfobacterales bacterium]|nr:MAG: ABC transporter permease [Desulfobacterales bacterium]